jgi:hypothetical protein
VGKSCSNSSKARQIILVVAEIKVECIYTMLSHILLLLG